MDTQHITTDCANVYVKHIDNDKVYYVLTEQKNRKLKERIIGKKSSGITPREAYDKYQEKLFKTKRHKTKYNGVFWRNSTTNGKKDKTYYIVYNDENGKIVESKVGKESEGVGVNFAHQKYLESIHNIKHGELPPIKRKRRKIFTLDDAFNEYMNSVKFTKKSWKKDEGIYNLHLKEFHQLELVSLKMKDFESLKQEKLNKYSPRTVQYILAVARQIINYAIKHELITNYVNPIASGGVQVKRIDNEHHGFFTYEQAKLLLQRLKDYKGDSLVYPLTVICLYTGARFNEVASLTWNDINMDKRVIFFKATKEGNKREVAMTSLVYELLNELPKEDELVLPTKNKTKYKQMPKVFQKTVDELFPENKYTIQRYNNSKIVELSAEEREQFKKESNKRLTTHSLRHTHASWMAISGKFTLMEIRDTLGHKATQMTERYAHLIPQDRHRKAHEFFDSI